ncbi:MAG: heavy-metal-associated domain-containing protein [archaeon]
MSITVTVTDMSCDGCEDIVEGAVEDVSGVESVEADRESESVTVEGDVDVDAVVEAIDFAGYSPTREEPTEADETDESGDEEAESAVDEE